MATKGLFFFLKDASRRSGTAGDDGELFYGRTQHVGHSVDGDILDTAPEALVTNRGHHSYGDTSRIHGHEEHGSEEEPSPVSIQLCLHAVNLRCHEVTEM